ncbi:hypothetical protein LINGRAPRIM_LOCUS888 [Linum grandiflorum]
MLSKPLFYPDGGDLYGKTSR